MAGTTLDPVNTTTVIRGRRRRISVLRLRAARPTCTATSASCSPAGTAQTSLSRPAARRSRRTGPCSPPARPCSRRSSSARWRSRGAPPPPR
uniref:Uncharacterized protein n=1 Tax=Oryza glumipatula TaxID=40148 RepID=A0A0D9YBB8_9ORYZ